MAFESKVTCDALNCVSEKNLRASHPADAEIEFYQLEENGWLIDEVNSAIYCPRCSEQMSNQEKE